MSSQQLGYSDFEQLTQDIFARPLMIEICENFLKKNISEESELYAKAKLAKYQSISPDEPKLDAIKAHKDLVDLAKRNGNAPLEALSLVKIACANRTSILEEPGERISEILGESVKNKEELNNFKIQKFTEALGITLGVNFSDIDSAIEAAKTTSIAAGDPMLVPFVAAAVGIANELAENDLDKGYEIFANVTKLAPDIMYSRVSAIFNRLNKYIRDNDENALEQAKVLLDEVSQFSQLQPQLTEDNELSAIHLRKKEAMREFINELSEGIQSQMNRLELASLLERPSESPAEATLNRYRESVKESKASLSH